MVIPKIAVIGGGTAGIITSRHLLQNGLKPYIFEKQSKLGGLWSIKNEEYLKWNTNWKTNLSKYTCCFSDLLHSDDTLFLDREGMNRYLDRYCKEYLMGERFYYDCRVVNVQCEDGKYNVEWIHLKDSEEMARKADERNKLSMLFDGVVLTSGFFTKPNKVIPSNPQIKYIHASEYTSSSSFQYKNICVIGSSFTSMEIVSDLAKESSIENIHHIMSKIPYVIPRYIPSNGVFLPIDLAFYKRTSPYPKEEEIVPSEESIKKKHDYLTDIIGGKTGKHANVLGMPDTSKMPYVAISDGYISLLSLPHTNIHPIHDRLTTISNGNVELSSGNTLENVDLIIDCTGYQTDISYLSKDMQEVLIYDKHNQFAPISSCFDTYHPELTNLGMVGMYRGPYFGIMELQARLISQLLHKSLIQKDVWGLGQEVDTKLLEDSDKIRGQNKKQQFPHGDYVGYMDTLSSHLLDFTPQMEYMNDNLPVIPSFYTNNKSLSEKAYKEIQALYNQSKEGAILPSILIHSLIGKYTFHRKLTYMNTKKGYAMNNYNTNDDEYIDGTVTYTFQSEGSLRYREDGIYKTSKGISLPVFREYDYIVKDKSLDVYFIEGGKRAHLFLSLEFKLEGDVWVASNDHLCSKDLYKGKFCIEFQGVDVIGIRMEYRVNGPEKDYLSTTEIRPCYK